MGELYHTRACCEVIWPLDCRRRRSAIDENPNGVHVPTGYVYIGDSGPSKTTRAITPDPPTQTDDCCEESNLRWAKVMIDGQAAARCP